MSRESFVFALGILLFITPFLGIPNSYKEWVVIVSGIVIMFLGYSLRRSAFLRSISDDRGERRGDAFVESVGMKPETPESAPEENQ